MNDAPFGSIYVDTALLRGATAAIVAELTGGVAANGDVDCSWTRIAVDDNDGMFERQQDPDDFSGWHTSLEVMPPHHAERADVVRWVVSLMNGLTDRGMRVPGDADYAQERPGGGEVAGPSAERRLESCSID